MTRVPLLAFVAGCLLAPVVVHAQGANAKVARGSPTAEKLPVYVIDPTWPPTLPNDWLPGDIRGLFVDDRDHLWIIHMPSSLTDQEIGAATKPPIADCCFPAPPVLEIDADGKVVRSWGGPGTGYTWFVATLQRAGRVQSQNIDHFTLLRDSSGAWKFVNGSYTTQPPRAADPPQR